MRKDVKVGFAVGGVLLAVLIVYVLVVPGTDKNGNQVADIGATAQQTTPSNTKPDQTSAPAANVTQQGTPTPSGAQQATPAEKPADPFATSASDQKPTAPLASADHKGDVDWAKLLDGGSPPPMMSTSGKKDETSTNESSKEMVAGADRPGSTSTPPTMMASSGEPTTRPSGPRTHTVQPHETLSAISTAAYGNPNHWKAIAAANPKVDANKLKPGIVLVLPDISQGNDSKKATASEHAAAPDSTTIDSVKEYRVRSGDTLHRISVKLYGKADRAEKIYEINKDAIGSDPDRLKLNMVLKLPEAPTVASR